MKSHTLLAAAELLQGPLLAGARNAHHLPDGDQQRRLLQSLCHHKLVYGGKQLVELRRGEVTQARLEQLTCQVLQYRRHGEHRCTHGGVVARRGGRAVLLAELYTTAEARVRLPLGSPPPSW